MVIKKVSVDNYLGPLTVSALGPCGTISGGTTSGATR